MPSNYIGNPPVKFVIPVTLGCDRAFTVKRRNEAGELADWDAEVYIVVDIDRASPTTVQAAVSGSNAVFLVESSVCDLVKNSTRWRIVMSDDEGFEAPIAVGSFERHDG
jgi:hypothetical protein